MFWYGFLIGGIVGVATCAALSIFCISDIDDYE